MTPSEFKAWFEGFTESMDGPPSLKQWEKIQARVKQITGHPITYPLYVDRYLGNWQPPIYPLTTFCQNAISNVQLTAAQPHVPNNVITMNVGVDGETGFDSHAAMAVLGRADAEDLARA